MAKLVQKTQVQNIFTQKCAWDFFSNFVPRNLFFVISYLQKNVFKYNHLRKFPDIYDHVLTKNWAHNPIGFPVVPTLIFDKSKAILDLTF